MLWKTVLNNWEKGNTLTYPKKLKNPFIWRTSVYKNNGNCKFEEEFVECSLLDVEEDYTDFKKYIKNSNDKYVTTFLNLSKDTILVVPMPRKNKNFSNLKNFIDQASITQQKKLWKEVYSIVNIEKNKNKYLWISTHGTGVPYLHIRISTSPKYYGNSKLSNPDF